MAEFILRLLYCNNEGAEPSKLSAKWLEQNCLFNGDEHVFPGGYSQIIRILAKDIKISLNQKIQNINYSQEKVILTNQSGEAHLCDHVIVTAPLGVLKKQELLCFSPQLPESKLKSINNLGLARLDKLFLEFDKVFWDSTVDFYNYLGDEWNFILNVYKHHTKKPILVFHLYAD